MRKGTLPRRGGQIGSALGLGLSEALVEQPQQEEAVELLETPAAALFLHHLQAIAQVVDILVEEALLLNEVDEHHAVEHEEAYQSWSPWAVMPSMNFPKSSNSFWNRS